MAKEDLMWSIGGREEVRKSFLGEGLLKPSL